MLYHLLYPLAHDWSGFNIFRYITVRSFIAFLFVALCSIIIGKFYIAFIKRHQFGQVIRTDGPQSHLKKTGTPTFGGGLILGCTLLGVLFVGNFYSIPLWATLFVILSYFFLGLTDDYLKILKKDPKGVSGKGKLLWQFTTAIIIVSLLIHFKIIDTCVYIPFLKGLKFDLGYFYILFGAIVIVGSSNAVNLTDGLDGLAIGPVITSSVTLGVLAYLAGHSELASYLYIPYVEKAGELGVLASALIGASVGFLWYNAHPAEIFMGDIGSLPLGGALGTMAVLTKNEILFVLIGGIFVAEAVSVILQVGSYKLRKKRIFKMAPLHHHFELSGWAETKVVVRFWIISIMFAILSLATLKIR